MLNKTQKKLVKTIKMTLKAKIQKNYLNAII